MEVVNPLFAAINLQRAARWHGDDIDSWSKPDWMVALIGELGEACGVLEEQMTREAPERPLSEYTLNEMLVLVMWQLGEAANAAKKLRRIEDDIQSVSERTLDVDQANAVVRDALLHAAALLGNLLAMRYQVALSHVVQLTLNTTLDREHQEKTEEELRGAFSHEMADVQAYHTLNVARWGITAEEQNAMDTEVFNSVSERYDFPERI